MRDAVSHPDCVIPVATYAQLDLFVRAFADGFFNLLVLIGGPGLGKSRVVRQAVGDHACWIDGHATAFRIYCDLWRHRDEPVVLDDVDGLYADRDGIRLLKCLAQTEPVKTVGWHTDARTLQREGIPRQFTTASRVALIANEWKAFNVNVAALQDRGQVVHFLPSGLELHRRTAHWFWDQEIFDFVGQYLHLIAQPSMRHYLAAWELKQAQMDWQQLILSRCLSGKAVLVAQLKANAAFRSEEERAEAFMAAGHGCRATYFSVARKLRPVEALPQIKVQGVPRAPWLAKCTTGKSCPRHRKQLKKA
jgi:hypothetical protein